MVTIGTTIKNHLELNPVIYFSLKLKNWELLNKKSISNAIIGIDIITKITVKIFRSCLSFSKSNMLTIQSYQKIKVESNH